MRIGLVAGEASGDLLGAGLIQAIRAIRADACFEGVAGPLMRDAGCDAWADSEALAVMGLIEPLMELPRLLKLRRALFRRWIAAPPDVFVGIDAPEFNLGLARRLRRRGVRTMQYVSPQVWAWRQGRVRKIGRAVDLVLCLLPFEKDFYDRHGVPAEVVGHPLADKLPFHLERADERRALGIDRGRVVAVMPGSRSGEVARLGPVFVAAAKLLAARYPDIAFVAPMANANAHREFRAELEAQDAGHLFTVLEGEAPRAIVAADVVLLASGTAALQTALLRRAMVSAYRVAPTTYYLARLLRLLKVDYFTMPNLLTDEPLVPEFLQHEATPAALADAVGGILDDDERRRSIEAAFAELRRRLGLGADRRAAAAVIDMALREEGHAR